MKKRLSENAMTGEIATIKFFACFFDGFILWVALAGIAVLNNWPLAGLDYWSCVLIRVITMVLFTNNIGMGVKVDYIARMMLRGERP